MFRKLEIDEPFEEKNSLNIYWKIKNFSYCWEKIRSPDFTYSENLWRLQLLPEDVKCKIECLNTGDPSVITKISFLTCDGSEQVSTLCRWKSCLLASKDVIFGERRSAFLPKDTLTIRCQIKNEYTLKSSYMRESGKVSIQSKIGVKRKCFFWNLKNFRPKNRNKKLSVENSKQYGDIQLNLKSVGGINSDEQFYIDVSRTGGEKCYCVLKVSVLNNDGKALNYVSDEYIFEREDREQFWRFPPIIRKSKLLACKNDTLSLKCEFAITLGKVSDQTAIYSYNEDIVPLLKDSDDPSMCFKEESCSTDLQTDLKSILDNGTFCDVRLQVGSDVIPVHKNILTARSPVFKAMFTKDMKETINNTVVIEDIDAKTVHRLLLYMYTDTISDFQWENIMSLYSAADKYEVLSLKQKCSSFLKDNLSFSNVCEILVLADLHQDADLKSLVYDFLSKYDTEVFASEAWKELEKYNSSLAFQTLREICSNKRLE